MFHNHLTSWQLLLPTWGSEDAIPRPYLGEDNLPMLDKLGNVAWADHADNVIVLIVRGATNSQWNEPVTGREETKFRAGPVSYEPEQVGPWITVRRTSNKLIVIRANGIARSYPLPPDVVKRFHESHPYQPYPRVEAHISDSLESDLGTLLDLQNAADFRSDKRGTAIAK